MFAISNFRVCGHFLQWNRMSQHIHVGLGLRNVVLGQRTQGAIKVGFRQGCRRGIIRYWVLIKVKCVWRLPGGDARTKHFHSVFGRGENWVLSTPWFAWWNRHWLEWWRNIAYFHRGCLRWSRCNRILTMCRTLIESLYFGLRWFPLAKLTGSSSSCLGFLQRPKNCWVRLPSSQRAHCQEKGAMKRWEKVCKRQLGSLALWRLGRLGKSCLCSVVLAVVILNVQNITRRLARTGPARACSLFNNTNQSNAKHRHFQVVSFHHLLAAIEQHTEPFAALRYGQQPGLGL